MISRITDTAKCFNSQNLINEEFDRASHLGVKVHANFVLNNLIFKTMVPPCCKTNKMWKDTVCAHSSS